MGAKVTCRVRAGAKTPWNLIAHFFWPRNIQPIDGINARGFASRRREREIMALSLRIDPHERIEAVRCRAVGSGITVACGSVFSELIQDTTLEHALGITPEDVADALDGLSPRHRSEATLPLVALRSAVEDWRRRHSGRPSSREGCYVHRDLPQDRAPRLA